MQPRGDLLVAVAAGDQLQHLALARRQRVELRVDGGLARAERVEDEAGEPRREDRVAVGGAVDRVDQVGAGDRLRHVAARAGADHVDHVLGRVGDGEREEADARPLGRDLRDHRVAAAVRQVHVEQDDVRVELADQRHRLGDGAGLADDLDRVAELAPHAGAEEVVVVDEHDAPAAHGCLPRRSSTSVPVGRGRELAVPPARAIRPRIDSAMPCDPRGTASGSKPRAAVAHVDRDLVVADVDEGRDLVGARVPGRVRHRLARREDERLDALVERHVAGADELDRDAVQLLDLGGGRVHRGREALRSPVRAIRVEPGAQLALLPPRERGDAARIVRLPLDERERLEHGVVHAGRHLGPLLRADAGGPLGVPLDGEPPGPRAEHEQERDRDGARLEGGVAAVRRSRSGRRRRSRRRRRAPGRSRPARRCGRERAGCPPPQSAAGQISESENPKPRSASAPAIASSHEAEQPPALRRRRAALRRAGRARRRRTPRSLRRPRTRAART